MLAAYNLEWRDKGVSIEITWMASLHTCEELSSG